MAIYVPASTLREPQKICFECSVTRLDWAHAILEAFGLRPPVQPIAFVDMPSNDFDRMAIQVGSQTLSFTRSATGFVFNPSVKLTIFDALRSLASVPTLSDALKELSPDAAKAAGLRRQFSLEAQPASLSWAEVRVPRFPSIQVVGLLTRQS